MNWIHRITSYNVCYTKLLRIILFRKDKKFADSIENYFLIWIENKEFQKELEKEGFDISGNLSESRITSYNVCYTKLLRVIIFKTTKILD